MTKGKDDNTYNCESSTCSAETIIKLLNNQIIYYSFYLPQPMIYVFCYNSFNIEYPEINGFKFNHHLLYSSPPVPYHESLSITQRIVSLHAFL